GVSGGLVRRGGHLTGEPARICGLTGYAGGGLGVWLERPVPRLLAAALIGVGAGEILRAGAGLIASDPGVTLSAVRQVLPITVLYDILLCPIVLFLAALTSRRAAIRPLGTRGLFRPRAPVWPPAPRSPGRPPPAAGA